MNFAVVFAEIVVEPAIAAAASDELLTVVLEGANIVNIDPVSPEHGGRVTPVSDDINCTYLSAGDIA
jgi:hypothetical protein